MLYCTLWLMRFYATSSQKGKQDGTANRNLMNLSEAQISVTFRYVKPCNMPILVEYRTYPLEVSGIQRMGLLYMLNNPQIKQHNNNEMSKKIKKQTKKQKPAKTSLN